MQQVGFFGLRRGTKESEITTVEVPFDGSVEDALRYVLRFCKESYNWPDTITLGGGLDRTEDGKRIYIVGQRPATDDERRARGIPDNSAEKVTTEDGGVVGSIEFVRATPKHSILIFKSVTAGCQQFMDALEQKLNAQRLIAGDVLRLPATSGVLAGPQADSGAVEEEAKEKGGGIPNEPDIEHASHDEWFDWFCKAKRAGSRINLKTLSQKMGLTYGYVRKLHVKYKAQKAQKTTQN